MKIIEQPAAEQTPDWNAIAADVRLGRAIHCDTAEEVQAAVQAMRRRGIRISQRKRERGGWIVREKSVKIVKNVNDEE